MSSRAPFPLRSTTRDQRRHDAVGEGTCQRMGNSCVEQRRHAGMIEVRDTKDAGAGPVLRLTPVEYAAWLDGARKGEFGSLIDRTA